MIQSCQLQSHNIPYCIYSNLPTHQFLRDNMSRLESVRSECLATDVWMVGDNLFLQAKSSHLKECSCCHHTLLPTEEVTCLETAFLLLPWLLFFYPAVYLPFHLHYITHVICTHSIPQQYYIKFV